MSRSALAALGLLLAGALAVALWPARLGHAWLAALFFWSGVAVGSTGLLLVMRLVGGRWREQLGPALEAGSRALWPVALAALPVLVGLAALYPWVDQPQPGFQGVWLQPWAFAVRTLVWFAGLGIVLLRPGRAVAAAGLLVLVPWGSLVAVDWLMSLDPAFHSSGFGLQALSVQFTVALMVAVPRMGGDPDGTVGGVMLTLLLLWCYFAYLTFFINWSGNTPAGAEWYLVRAAHGWGWVAAAAFLLHLLPLLVLLSGAARRSAWALTACAVSSLAGDALQAAWLVLPTDGAPDLVSIVAYVAALALIGAPVLLAGRR